MDFGIKQRVLAGVTCCIFALAGNIQAQPSPPSGGPSGGGPSGGPSSGGPSGGQQAGPGGKKGNRGPGGSGGRQQGPRGGGRGDRDRGDHGGDLGRLAVPLALGAAAAALTAPHAPPPPHYPAPVAMVPPRPIGGSTVAALQSRLNHLGYSAGPADGVYGAGTRNAVIRFQSDYGLVADGVAGPTTQAHLARVAGF